MMKRPAAVLCVCSLLLHCASGLAGAAGPAAKTQAQGALTQPSLTFDGGRGATAGEEEEDPFYASLRSPKILRTGAVPSAGAGFRAFAAEPPSPGDDEKDPKKIKTKAEAGPSDPKAVAGAAILGMAGALLGFALGGPIGACLGFLIGVLVGALAAKVYQAATDSAKKKQPTS